MEKMIALIEYEEYNHLGIEEVNCRLYYSIERDEKKLFIEKETTLAGLPTIVGVTTSHT